MNSIRMRRKPHGLIKIAVAHTGKSCCVCGSDKNIRFVLLHGKHPGDRSYFRACSDCLDELGIIHGRLKAQLKGVGNGVQSVPRVSDTQKDFGLNRGVRAPTPSSGRLPLRRPNQRPERSSKQSR